MLNAKYHAQEAEIVAQAAARAPSPSPPTWPAAAPTSCSAATPSTWRASSSLNEGVAEKVAKGEEKYVDDDEYVNFFHVDSFYRVKRADWDRIYTHFEAQTKEEHKEVVNLGGLHIIGTERHEARRIDNQLRGRAGRQGDPGSSRFFLSLEDDLMRIFGSDRISGLMQRLGMEEGVPIEHGMVSRAIERAQKQVEAQNFAVRKHLLEYDDVMNKQRESVYTLRREILEGKIHLSEEEVVGRARLPAGDRRRAVRREASTCTSARTSTKTTGTSGARPRAVAAVRARRRRPARHRPDGAGRAARHALGARSSPSTRTRKSSCRATS